MVLAAMFLHSPAYLIYIYIYETLIDADVKTGLDSFGCAQSTKQIKLEYTEYTAAMLNIYS